jgi:hypothetical protein
VFPKLKGCTDEAELADLTWQDFREGVLSSPIGGSKEMGLQLMYSANCVSSDRSAPDTMGVVGKVETILARMTQMPDDNTQIWLVHTALHPRLKDDVAYAADSKPWPTYAAFRANLVNHAATFDQMIARESGRAGGQDSKGNARQKRRFRRSSSDGQQRVHPKFSKRSSADKGSGDSGGGGKFRSSKGKPAGGSGGSGDITCYTCGDKGHIARNCPKDKVGSAATAAGDDSNAMQLNSSSAKLPVCAVVDSSAQQPPPPPVGEARCRCRKVWLTRIDYYYY